MSEKASRQNATARRDIEEAAAIVVDAALQLHRDLGPGLLETVYEAVLAKRLQQRGLLVERQKPVPIRYQGIELNKHNNFASSRLRVHQKNKAAPS